MSSVRDELKNSLPTDSEYRHAYADEILNLLVCTQMRVLREQRGITQEAMAAALDTTQTAVSRLERVNYSAWNIRTLKKVAKALDLRLRITFESFGTLWKDVQSLKRHKLERYKITDDPEFATAKDTTVEESAATETTRDFKVVPRPPKQIEMFPPGDATDIDQISSRDSETHDGARYALVG